MAWRILEPERFPWFDYSRYSFSLGLEADGRTFLSGHTASTFDPEARRIVVRGGVAEQTRTAYDKVEAILAAAGQTLADVVRIVEYVTPEGIEGYAEAEAVRRERLGDQRPAVNTVPVRALLRPEAWLEIEALAGPPGISRPVGPRGEAGYESAGLVFLPSLEAVGADDSIAAADLIGQTEAIYERAAEMLAAFGLGLDRVVKTLDLITPAALRDYKRTGAVRRDRLGPVFPAAAGIIMPRLVHPEALVQIDLVAARDPPQLVNPGWERYDKLTYSPGVKTGRLLFLSGQAALDPETEQVLHAGDVVAQADYTYRNILQVVEAAGGGPESLVKTVEFTTPAALPRYREVAGVRERWLRRPYPVSTGPVCEALLRPEMLIEIDPLAILP